jgi:hypothetical protein
VSKYDAENPNLSKNDRLQQWAHVTNEYQQQTGQTNKSRCSYSAFNFPPKITRPFRCKKSSFWIIKCHQWLLLHTKDPFRNLNFESALLTVLVISDRECAYIIHWPYYLSRKFEICNLWRFVPCSTVICIRIQNNLKLIFSPRTALMKRWSSAKYYREHEGRPVDQGSIL